MAPDKKEKKRKASVASDPPAKKTKKVESKPAEAPEVTATKPISKKKTVAKAKDTKDIKDSKDTETAPSVQANSKAVRQPKPRKRAADFLDDEKDEPTSTSTTQKKSVHKKSKKEEPVSAVKKTGKAAPKVVDVVDESDDEDIVDESPDSESEEEAEDDQTAALITGFESSGDEAESGDEGFNNSKPIPKIPKKVARKLKNETIDSPKEPGTVYVGRIPHGFYEHQMRAYFSQFGDITNLRLSRNRTTGSSKHYAFVEFSSSHVANIVASTMDNYLMYGHILKCKFVPKEQLHPEIWKGANRRFKKTPWNRIEKKRLEKPKTREQWSKSIEKEQTKREAKADKLKALGYQMPLPQLKSAADVTMQDEKTIEAVPVEEPVKAVEAPKEKKGKKAAKAEKILEEPKKEAATPEARKSKKKTVKKSKA